MNTLASGNRVGPRLVGAGLAVVWWCAIATLNLHGQSPADARGVLSARPDVVLTDEARRVHAAGWVFDGHNDLPWTMRRLANSSFDQADIREPQPQFHTDIARLRAGGVKAQFWSVFVPVNTALNGRAMIETLEQIELVRRMCERYPDVFEMASSADDVERIVRAGRIASLVGVEGGHSIENSLVKLRRLYQLGARYMTLTHSKATDWCDSATDEARHGGLTPFGCQVVREMNSLGMLVDLSHVSDDAMRDALAVSRAPVIFSHSSARAINDSARNVPDDILRATAQNGGVVMVNFMSGYIVPTETWKADRFTRGSVHDVVDHIDHIVRIAGIDHVGLGSDFDGVNRLPHQLDDVSYYPYITQELLTRGYQPADIHKVLGGNALRALRDAERVASQPPDP